MKIISTGKRRGTSDYSVSFDDGTIITLRQTGDDWELVGTCSVGMDSYYIKNNFSYPKRNLNKRVEMAIPVIQSRSNRYKK